MMTSQMSSVSPSLRGTASPLECPTVSMDPPLPVYFFNVVSGLRDKSAKGYPVKKVLNTFGLISCSHPQ